MKDKKRIERHVLRGALSLFITLHLVFGTFIHCTEAAQTNTDYEQAVEPEMVETVSAYLEDEKLFTFFQMPEGWETSDNMDVNVVGHANDVLLKDVKKVSDPDTFIPKFYYILVDASGTMTKYKAVIRSFVTELIERGDENSIYSIGYFGENTFFTDAVNLGKKHSAEILKILDELDYQEQWTNLYTAIEDAINQQRAMTVSEGCLTQIILITDGIPDYASKEEPAGLREEAAGVISESGDIILHYVQLGDWSNQKDNLFKWASDFSDVMQNNATGRHITIDNDTAVSGADEIINFTDSLCRMKFDIGENTGDSIGSFQFILTNNTKDDFVTSIPIDYLYSKELSMIVPFSTIENGEGPESGEDIGSGESEGTENPDRSEGTEELENSEEAEGTEEPEVVTEDVTEALTEAVSENISVTATDNSGKKIIQYTGLIWGIVGIGIALLVAGMAVFILRKKGKPACNEVIIMGTGSQLRLIPRSGVIFTPKYKVGIGNGVSFGKGSDCDLNFPQLEQTIRYGKIYEQNTMFYVQPILREAIIYLNNMRVFAANPLRDGDRLEFEDMILDIEIR